MMNIRRAWLVFRAVSGFRLATFVDLDPDVKAANPMALPSEFLATIVATACSPRF